MSMAIICHHGTKWAFGCICKQHWHGARCNQPQCANGGVANPSRGDNLPPCICAGNYAPPFCLYCRDGYVEPQCAVPSWATDVAKWLLATLLIGGLFLWRNRCVSDIRQWHHDRKLRQRRRSERQARRRLSSINSSAATASTGTSTVPRVEGDEPRGTPTSGSGTTSRPRPGTSANTSTTPLRPPLQRASNYGAAVPPPLPLPPRHRPAAVAAQRQVIQPPPPSYEQALRAPVYAFSAQPRIEPPREQPAAGDVEQHGQAEQGDLVGRADVDGSVQLGDSRPHVDTG